MNQFSLTAVLVLLNLLCIGFTLTLTQWLSIFEVITTADVHLYLIVLVSLGLISIFLILSGMSDSIKLALNIGYNKFSY